MRSADQQRLYEASGKVAIADPLVAFLYELMRDELPPGKVAALVRSARGLAVDGRPVLRVNDYTNGWLARYCEWLARDLRG